MEQHDLNYHLQNLRKNTSQVGIYVTVIFMVFLAVIMVCFATLSWVNWVWMIPLMGWIQYYIVISGHEAVHKTLCPNSHLNEWVGVIGQAMVGVNFTAYRLQHIDHHRAPTYDTDPDAHIYMGVLKQQPGGRRLLWLTLGTLVEIVIKIRQKGIEGYGTERQIKPEIQQQMRRDSLLVIGMQLAIMVSAWCLLRLNGFLNLCQEFIGYSSSKETLFTLVELGGQLVVSYAIFWTIPLFFVTVFLNRCRIVIEHGLALVMASDNPDFAGLRIPTVEVVPSTVERWLFAPFSFNYHCTHHAYMTVPHYNLKQLNAVMLTQPIEKQNKLGFLQIEGGYLQALWKIIHHPKVWE